MTIKTSLLLANQGCQFEQFVDEKGRIQGYSLLVEESAVRQNALVICNCYAYQNRQDSGHQGIVTTNHANAVIDAKTQIKPVCPVEDLSSLYLQIVQNIDLSHQRHHQHQTYVEDKSDCPSKSVIVYHIDRPFVGIHQAC